MPYIEGFVAAVPTANRDKYIERAEAERRVLQRHLARRASSSAGATTFPHGDVTDFYRATQAKDDETVVFSWIEYPDKETRDAANEKMRADPEMANMEMPFDMKRMFWGGFEQVVGE